MILRYWIWIETQYLKGLESTIWVINNFVKIYLSFLLLGQREKVRQTLAKLHLKLRKTKADEEKVASLKKKTKKVNYLDIFSPPLLQIICDLN